MKDFSERIGTARREAAMTQEQLAQELGVSAQAVSKWENGQSYPDITLLPKLAALFRCSVDELLGCGGAADGEARSELRLPWADDPGTLHAVLFAGHTLIGAQDVTNCPEASRISFEYEGEALSIQSVFSVQCDSVQGDVKAGGGVTCDSIGGSVQAGGGVNCDSVGGSVEAGGGVNCDDVAGNVAASGSVTCGDVGGNVQAGGSLSCGQVQKNAASGGAAEGFRFEAGAGRRSRRQSLHIDSRELERSVGAFSRKIGELGRQLGDEFGRAFTENTQSEAEKPQQEPAPPASEENR